jgi:hypothetical protein
MSASFDFLKLPVAIQHNVFVILPQSDLRSLSLVNKHLRLLAMPYLSSPQAEEQQVEQPQASVQTNAERPANDGEHITARSLVCETHTNYSGAEMNYRRYLSEISPRDYSLKEKSFEELVAFMIARGFNESAAKEAVRCCPAQALPQVLPKRPEYMPRMDWDAEFCY